MRYEYKQFYRRKLPHIHSPGATLFVTFRLAGTVPKSILTKWKAEKELLERELSKPETVQDLVRKSRKEFHREWFRQFEIVLDKAEHGPTWLKDERIAKMVYESLLHRNDREYNLYSFSIMSNHAHVVFRPLLNEQSLIEVRESAPLRFVSTQPTLGAIMQSLKGYTARKANKILGRTGTFWDAESYDHQIADQAEFGRIERYVLNNPVKAGLVSDWKDYKWNWKRPI